MLNQLSSCVADNQNRRTLDKLHLEMQDAGVVDLVAYFARSMVSFMHCEFNFLLRLWTLNVYR